MSIEIAVRIPMMAVPLLLFVCLSLFLTMPLARAEEEAAPSSNNSSPASSAASGDKQHAVDKTMKPEEDDYSTTPFTEYGEFHEASDEEADTRFLQFGRFFGASFGLGFQFVDGNRGALWEGGFPLVDLRLHYWFDFNVALDLGFTTVSQYYNTTVENLGHVDVNMLIVSVDIKYYFDTKNLSAPISFANPYILVGAGSYSKTENSVSAQSQDQDSSLGVCAGGGFEFIVSPRKVSFAVEGKVHIVIFKDTYTTRFVGDGLPDLTGQFFTFSGNLLFTW